MYHIYMARLAIQTSPSVARLLRERRKELGLSLRDVEKRTQKMGQVIPFTTLAKVEQGNVDPGIRRLHLLLRLYDLPPQLAHDLLDLEEFAEEMPDDSSIETLKEVGLEAWKSGNLSKGLAYLFALRSRTPSGSAARTERQWAILDLAVAAGAMGKVHLAHQLVDDLLQEPPEPETLVNVLIQAAVCWHWLGSCDAALGFLWRAEQHVAQGDHQKMAWVLHERASTLATLGQFVEAEEALDVAIQRYRDAGDAYGECKALGVRVRVRYDQGDLEGALAAGKEGRERAEKSGFERLTTMRSLDEGRCLVGLDRSKEGLGALRRCLSSAIATEDSTIQFYAHFYLWKAYVADSDTPRAELELNNARYFVRFVDETTQEAMEIRATLA